MLKSKLFVFAVIFILLLITGCTSEYEVVLEVDPKKAGEVSGDGTYQEGEEATVEAHPKEGYQFAGWQKDGEKLSDEERYTVEISSGVHLVASFIETEVNVKVDVKPEDAGRVYGDGTYQEGEEVALEAETNEDYSFHAWFHEGEGVAYEEYYQIMAKEDTVLTAHYVESDLVKLTDQIESALSKKSWREAGVSLEKTKEMIEVEDDSKPYVEEYLANYGDIDLTKAFSETNKIISLLQNEKVITKDQVIEFIEELEEIRPREPVLEVLEKDAEELYNWFKSLSKWRTGLRQIGLKNGLFEGEGLQKIYAISEEYLQEPVALYWLYTWEIGETTVYYRLPASLHHLGDGTFFGNNTQLVDAEVGKDSLSITLELKETIESLGVKLNPGQYQLTYQVDERDDGTFRVGEYKIKDLEAEEIVQETSTTVR